MTVRFKLIVGGNVMIAAWNGVFVLGLLMAIAWLSLVTLATAIDFIWDLRGVHVLRGLGRVARYALARLSGANASQAHRIVLQK